VRPQGLASRLEGQQAKHPSSLCTRRARSTRWRTRFRDASNEPALRVLITGARARSVR